MTLMLENSTLVRFKLLIVTNMKVAVFWDVVLFSLAEID
jgi:hypothetical protein